MDYKELTRRYLNAETSLKEEALLSEANPSKAQVEQRAIAAMIYQAQIQEPRRGWQMAVALAASVVVLLGIFHFAKPQTIYGYYNGEPVTSLAQAEQMTEQMFGNMLLAENGADDILDELFYLNH